MIAQGLMSAGASSTARHLQIAGGLLALLLATLIAVGLLDRLRARVSMPGRYQSAGVPKPSRPTVFWRLSARTLGTSGGGCWWLGFAAGTPLPPETYAALAAIAASGAAIATQLSGALVFLVVMLAVVEVPLVSYLVTPAKTQAVMLQLHNWVGARRRQILAVILAVVGALLVANGV